MKELYPKENLRGPVDASTSVYANLLTALGIKTRAGEEALLIALDNIKLLDTKQIDYGSKNISRFGAHGCVVRMSDKFERLVNLYKNKRKRPINESIEDTFRDLSNYAIIALMCEKGVWPNE